MEEISRSEQYLMCNQCKNIFSKEYMEEWLNRRAECPLCRKKWTNDTIYKSNSIIYEWMYI